MELTIKEVATLLGKSRRTIRSQVARGELPGVKRNGKWLIDRRNLPLNESQRRILQAKADRIRNAVDDVLPSRAARVPGQRPRSLADLDAFRLGAQVLLNIRDSEHAALADAERERIADYLEQSLLAIAEAVQQFDRELKLAAVNRARSLLSHTVATMLLATGLEPEEPVSSWVTRLEGEVIPAVAGFLPRMCT